MSKIKEIAGLYRDTRTDHWIKQSGEIAKKFPDPSVVLGVAISAIAYKAFMEGAKVSLNHVAKLLTEGKDDELRKEMQAVFDDAEA